MRPIARNRQPIDDQDPPELRAIFAELTVRHPRKEAAKRGETPKEGYDDNTEVVFLGGEYLTRGSQYGFVNHVARWLYTYDYRAGQGLEVADLAIEVYTADCGCAPHLLVAARIERARIRAVYRAEPTRVFKPGDVVRLGPNMCGLRPGRLAIVREVDEVNYTTSSSVAVCNEETSHAWVRPSEIVIEAADAVDEEMATVRSILERVLVRPPLPAKSLVELAREVEFLFGKNGAFRYVDDRSVDEPEEVAVVRDHVVASDAVHVSSLRYLRSSEGQPVSVYKDDDEA